jgi:siroheme synthase
MNTHVLAIVKVLLHGGTEVVLRELDVVLRDCWVSAKCLASVPRARTAFAGHEREEAVIDVDDCDELSPLHYTKSGTYAGIRCARRWGHPAGGEP